MVTPAMAMEAFETDIKGTQYTVPLGTNTNDAIIGCFGLYFVPLVGPLATNTNKNTVACRPSCWGRSGALACVRIRLHRFFDNPYVLTQNV